jgi:hypothetical protein
MSFLPFKGRTKVGMGFGVKKADQTFFTLLEKLEINARSMEK